MPFCSGVVGTTDMDVEGVGIYLENLAKLFRYFDKGIAETISDYQRLMASHERVAHSFVEVARENDRNIQLSSKNFQSEMRKLKDGPAMASLQMDVSRYVKEDLPSITAERDKVSKMYKTLKEIRKSYDSHRYEIDKTEQSYAKKNKSLTKSRSYANLCQKRDAASAKYEAKKDEFENAVAHLKELIRNFVAHALPGYAVSSGSFAKYLGLQLESYAEGINKTAKEGAMLTNATGNGGKHRGSGDDVSGNDRGQKQNSTTPVYYIFKEGKYRNMT